MTRRLNREAAHLEIIDLLHRVDPVHAAFGVILMAGSIFNPLPYRIVIALQDIPPYTTLAGKCWPWTNGSCTSEWPRA